MSINEVDSTSEMIENSGNESKGSRILQSTWAGSVVSQYGIENPIKAKWALRISVRNHVNGVFNANSDCCCCLLF